jgi:hypothetical protein
MRLADQAPVIFRAFLRVCGDSWLFKLNCTVYCVHKNYLCGQEMRILREISVLNIDLCPVSPSKISKMATAYLYAQLLS